jgi:hypothetical protein
MPANLYCEIDGARHGPLTPAQLKELALEGKLQPTHPVWTAGMRNKLPASEIKGLFEDAPAEAPEPELLAEASVTYREGLPDIQGPRLATLLVESDCLRFTFADEDERDYRIAFPKVVALLEPARGDFPEAIKKKALAANVGGKVGKLAAGLFGQMIGGDAGEVVSKVGGGAAGMAEKHGQLGEPPCNRVTVVAGLRKKRRKVRFDVNGASAREMNEEAASLYRRIQKARDRFATAAQDDRPITLVEIPPEPRPRPSSTVVAPGRSAVDPAGAKPFRLMRGARVKGPYSLQELQGILRSGKLRADDLIGVETWLPLSSLSGLLLEAVLIRGPSSATKPADGAKDSDDAGFEIVSEAPPTEDGALRVDDEFKI